MSPQDAAHSGIEVAQRAEGAGDGAFVCVWGAGAKRRATNDETG